MIWRIDISLSKFAQAISLLLKMIAEFLILFTSKIRILDRTWIFVIS